MTIAESARVRGFAAHLLIRGRKATASTGETLTVIVQREALLPDAMSIAEAEKRVYGLVRAEAGSVANPRAVTSFTETESGDTYQVISFEENADDRVVWEWRVEKRRRAYA
jgi:hypothetical protein